MTGGDGNPWDGGARQFADYGDTPTGRLRFTLIAETLSRHLPTPPLRVLDAGCGSGETAIWLARRGDAVTAVDSAGEMLNIVRERATHLEPAVRERLRLVQTDLVEAIETWPVESFDLVLAHTLLDYVPEDNPMLVGLLKLLRPGGTISVVRINTVSGVLRAALNRHDLDAAARGLTDSTVHASLFGLIGQGSTVVKAANQLRRAGVNVIETYGIRTLADYLPAGLLEEPARYEELLQLECDLCTQSPYREMARYVHLIGIKPSA